jgi:hypothetical protein
MIGTLIIARLAVKLGLSRMQHRSDDSSNMLDFRPRETCHRNTRESTHCSANPQGFYLIGHGITTPVCLAGSVSPFPHTAGAASALLGFVQMMNVSLLSQAVVRLHDGTTVSLATTVSLMSLAVLLN